jgi:hypothetical protein
MMNGTTAVVQRAFELGTLLQLEVRTPSLSHGQLLTAIIAL